MPLILVFIEIVLLLFVLRVLLLFDALVILVYFAKLVKKLDYRAFFNVLMCGGLSAEGVVNQSGDSVLYMQTQT